MLIYDILPFCVQTQRLIKNTSALRFAILGAARIGPEALFKPAKTHPDVVVTAVACRDKTRGQQYAQKHDIPRTFSGPNAYHGKSLPIYAQKLVTDPDIDVVYIALPNGLHFEWTMRALEAGKHVLVEKPLTNTAEEARQIFALAEEKGLVALEALHAVFHPANHRVREIIQSGELGKVKSVVSHFIFPRFISPLFFEKDDVRFHYDLGGGSMTDLGVYPLAEIRFVTSTDTVPLEVTSAKAVGHPKDPERIDRAMHIVYALPNTDATAEVDIDLSAPGWGPFGLLPRMMRIDATIKLEGGNIFIYNFVMPTAFHFIRVSPKKGPGRFEQVYTFKDGKGEKSWSTYRYQLEAFVDKVRGRTPSFWHEPISSISELETIERVYTKAGMQPRPASAYKRQG
ncbi:NAD(P)-binding protein [Dichomitus squalens]|uniref:D-xylose 1-dehydrogenase (NADP(+), D-xylono-1,5-lactone-forming) n=1 Tax=Dichomitus squalens TaxID=114155 RepID=A0A4Q9MYR9_9APHY|nr:NAD(P)-binding protein [Dichomitus squalens]